ncbi:MAG: methyltransferase domain-containing protein [Byssovorax sp.]
MSDAPSALATPLPWDLVAGAYVLDLAPAFTHFAEEALGLAGVGSGTRVLDVATGPGTLALPAARRGAQVSAIDFSTEMIGLLRAQAALEELTGKIEALVGDGMALPFPDGAFDAAFSSFGLMFFPDRDRGLRELHRALRPGGRAVIATWTPFERVPLMATMFAALGSHIPQMSGPMRLALSDPGECRAAMDAAGFHDTTSSEVEHGVVFMSMAELWAAQQRCSAPLALLQQRLGDAWAPVAAGVLERMVAEHGAGAQRLAMIALLSSGLKAG